MNKLYLAFSLKHEDVPNIAITLSQDKRQALEQILNAIFLYHNPSFTKMIEDFVKVRDIFISNQKLELEKLLEKITEVIPYLSIQDDPKITHKINVGFAVGMLFNTPPEKQAYADRWFKARTSLIKFTGKGFKFSNRFLKSMMEEALRQYKSLDHNREDKLIFEFIMPIVEQNDANTMVEVEEVLNKFLTCMESK